MQRRPHRGRQVFFTETVPNLQPDEHCDDLLPHLSVFVTERLSAQRRQHGTLVWSSHHGVCNNLEGFDGF
jgi:hypothetical protein